ncbi:hypothetical protein GCM10009006_36290 [Haloarcula argentinensis]|uniref:Peptidase M48 domain-containing protein n=2 Tax=Haloarcula argentinensis TaxID=43776 RepID=A0A830FWY1_HALAR|nr:hypothetical protein GCM10009006_36290 [Haloarcula argentinensis]
MISTPFQLPIEQVGWYLVALLPLSYLAGGLAFQSVNQLRQIRAQRQIIDTRPTLSAYNPSFQWKSKIDATVIVINTDENDNRGPQAVRLPGGSAILLPIETIATLSNDELRAVLAHEESHFRHHREWLPASDAFLRLIGPFVGTLLGLPQPVIYALCGFRRREYQADQYAKERTSAKTLLSALDKLVEADDGNTSNDEEVSDCSDIVLNENDTATLTREAMVDNVSFGADPQHADGLFYPMFSSFSVIAHPLIGERKRAITPTGRLPNEAEGITLSEEK